MAIDMNKGMRPNLYELLEAGIYELPPASATELGGVIVGEGVNVDENGVISVPTSTAAYTKAETDTLLAERDVEIEANTTAISDETTARQAADYDMQTAISENTAAITAEETARANADADLQTQIDNFEPFRVKNWAGTLNLTLPYCTEDIANTSIPKAEFSIDDTEGALYQIVGMIAYEVFDATSGGNRINCWPVCQFTGNGQKTLTVRFMCAGTTRKTAQRINAWVLLKRRD